MVTTTINTDKESVVGLLIYQSSDSSSDYDSLVEKEWQSKYSLLLTTEGIISVHHYQSDMQYPICTCEECQYLNQEEIDCNPKTCVKCNGSIGSETWDVKTLLSKEEILKHLQS